MKRNWTEIGQELFKDNGATTEDGESLTKAGVEGAIDSLEWVDATVDQTLPAMPGMNIDEVVKELRIPYVTQLSYSCVELAPFGFYGIEGNYKNGRVRLYAIDCGTYVTPVCADHYQDNGEALAAAKQQRAAA